MSFTLTAVTIDAHDPARLAAFWAGLLGREVVEEAAGPLVPGEAAQLSLRFVASSEPKVGQNNRHLHLIGEAEPDQERIVDEALALGAHHLDVGQGPDEGHVVLADPEGNELCVIESSNGYLAGCGPLAEVTCDGSHPVGLFWRDVLGWPLVWDRDGETAVQSPRGGTKVSWGGEPVPAEPPATRLRFEITTTGDLADEVDTLVALGATRLAGQTGAGALQLADPDGYPFSLAAAGHSTDHPERRL